VPVRRTPPAVRRPTVAVAWLGLGGNLDDPETRLVEAVARLDEVPGVRVRRLSPGYRSAPHGPPGQPDYVNAVVEVDTTLEPTALLDATRAIETDLGRTRDGPRWGPRRIDIDVLLVGDVGATPAASGALAAAARPLRGSPTPRTSRPGAARPEPLRGSPDTPRTSRAELTIPHPRLAERRFVLQPLADLAPHLRHPILGRTIAELLDACADAPLHDGPFTLPRTVRARLLDHGGDLGLRAEGDSPADLVVAAAHGLVGAIVPRDALRESERRESVVGLRAPLERLSRAELGEALVDALTEILVWLDADGWLPARLTATFDGTGLRLVAFGQSIRGRELPIERSPKAVTRHGLRVVRRAARGGAGATWTAHLVIDL